MEPSPIASSARARTASGPPLRLGNREPAGLSPAYNDLRPATARELHHNAMRQPRPPSGPATARGERDGGLSQRRAVASARTRAILEQAAQAANSAARRASVTAPLLYYVPHALVPGGKSGAGRRSRSRRSTDSDDPARGAFFRLKYVAERPCDRVLPRPKHALACTVPCFVPHSAWILRPTRSHYRTVAEPTTCLCTNPRYWIRSCSDTCVKDTGCRPSTSGSSDERRVPPMYGTLPWAWVAAWREATAVQVAVWARINRWSPVRPRC